MMGKLAEKIRRPRFTRKMAERMKNVAGATMVEFGHWDGEGLPGFKCDVNSEWEGLVWDAEAVADFAGAMLEYLDDQKRLREVKS